MLARSRCLAILLLLPLTLFPIQYPTFAQGLPFRAVRYSEVLSCVPDSSGNFLLLNLQSKKALPAPQIHYLSLTDGRSVMVADFNCVIYRHDAQLLRCANPDIESIRFGQFQKNPPVFRLSITASNAALLKKIDFRCQAKSLLIKLPEKEKHIATRAGETIRRPINKKESADCSTDAMRDPVKKKEIAEAGDAMRSPLLKKESVEHSGNALRGPIPEGKPVSAAPVSQRKSAAALLSVDHPPFRSGGLFLSLENGNSKAELPPAAPEIKSRYELASLPEAAPDFRAKPEAAPDFRSNPQPEQSPLSVLQKYLRSADERKKQNEQLSGTKKSEQKKFDSDLKKTETAFAERLGEIQTVKAENKIEKTSKKDADAKKKITDSATKTPDQQSLSAEAKSSTDIADGASEAAKTASEDPPSQLEFCGKNPLQVKLKLFNSNKYKSFKLEDPPRFVIDLDVPQQVPENAIEPQTNPWLKSVRLGNPAEKRTRVVFDLAQSRVHIKEDFDEKQKLLTLTLGPALYDSASKGRQVIIDAGHGGSDPGAQRGDIQEKELTLSIAMKLKQYLEAQGIKVKMTRTDDSFVSLEDRVKITNELNPDAFVSIHINSLETDRDIKGIETYYQNGRSRQLAEKIHEQLVGKLQVPDRNVRKARFYVVNHTDNPAVLAEVGFISNKDERDKLISSEYQAKIAESVGQGLMLFLSGAAQPDSPLLSVSGTQAKANESLLTINKQSQPIEGKLR